MRTRRAKAVGCFALLSLSLALAGCQAEDNLASSAGKAMLEAADADPRAEALCKGGVGAQFISDGNTLKAARDSTTAEAATLYGAAFGEEKIPSQFPSTGEEFAALCVIEGDFSKLGQGGRHLLMYITKESAGGGLLAVW